MRKNKENKEAKKRARVESIQDERDWEMWVCEMAMGAGGWRELVSDAEGVGIVPSTIDVDAVPTDWVVAHVSGTQFKGTRANIDEPAPWAPRYDLPSLIYFFL